MLVLLTPVNYRSLSRGFIANRFQCSHDQSAPDEFPTSQQLEELFLGIRHAFSGLCHGAQNALVSQKMCQIMEAGCSFENGNAHDEVS